MMDTPPICCLPTDGGKNGKSMSNPRYANGNLRRKYRARFKAMNAQCGICNGAYGEIHYDEPSDAAHPLSFVIDEIMPISKYKQFGYASREEAARDWNNLQAAHYYCNAKKSDKINRAPRIRQQCGTVADGEW